MRELRPIEDIVKVLLDADFRLTLTNVPWGTSMMDHRDLIRLVAYLEYDQAVDIFGVDGVVPEGEWKEVVPWTVDDVLKNMEGDLEFAFDKALGQRGISANLMHDVMCMYLWIFQDPLMDEMDYYNYGLPDLYRIRDEYFPDMRPQ